MLIELEPDYCFLVPEGVYAGTCLNVQPKLIKAEEKLRITFKVDELSNPATTYVVARNFDKSLRQGSSFRNFLEDWLGEEFFRRSLKGKTFDPSVLIGQRGDVEVTHIFNEKYEKPYVFLHSVHPLGSKVKLDEAA
jgi:hypothetical protein